MAAVTRWSFDASWQCHVPSLLAMALCVPRAEVFSISIPETRYMCRSSKNPHHLVPQNMRGYGVQGPV